MNPNQLRPMPGHYLCELLDPEATPGGIIIPDQCRKREGRAQPDHAERCRVVMVGGPKMHYESKGHEWAEYPDCAEGDIVLVGRWAGRIYDPSDHDQILYWLAKFSEVVAVEESSRFGGKSPGWVSSVLSQHERLVDFFLSEMPEEIHEGSAVDNAIRLLREMDEREVAGKIDAMADEARRNLAALEAADSNR
jgi:co-chaperonin GroES (HSP10)